MHFLPFVLISLAHLAGFLFENESLASWTKPFLMPALAFLFWKKMEGKKSDLSKYIYIALGLSTAGDVFMDWAKWPGKEDWFLAGLGSFLLAHIAYVFCFKNMASPKNGFIKHSPLAAVPVLIFLVTFISFIWGKLNPAFLKMPVLIYASIISLMLVLAINTKGRIKDSASTSLIIGAILFVLSDSMIAINKFVAPFVGASLSIMVTYILGQYLIVRGVLIENE